MSRPDLHCVLGDPSLIDACDAARLVEIRDEDDAVIGRACFEVLYGPYLELAVAVRADAHTHLVPELVRRLVPEARRHGAHTLRTLLGSGQEHAAALLPGARVRDGRLELRLDDLG